MSTKYSVEPPPTGKAILHTTAGDLEIELFGKQTPLTTRNFLQHCLDGYYDNTVFHRLVPGFVLQGGDPTGTGTGGESIYADSNGEKIAKPGGGGVFKDEFHSRLRFDRRGLLGMANQGKDENGSQFFFTLGPALELQNKNTMFGRVVGDTVFNLLKMGEAEVAEGSDRPLYPEKILSAEILINPFEGMEKRDIKAKIVVVEGKKDKARPKRKAGKAMLSFADEEDFVPVAKKAKLGGSAKEEKPKLQARRKPEPTASSKDAKQAESESESESEEEEDETSRRKKALSETERQIAELKASMKRNNAAPPPKEEEKSAFESLIPETATRGRQKKRTAKDAPGLDLYKQFKSQIDSVPIGNNVEDDEPDPEADGDANGLVPSTATGGDEELCDLHFIPNCMSCAKWKEDEEKEEEDEDENWFNHKLSFAKDRLGKDLEWKKKNEELAVIDPREKERELGIMPPKGGNRRDERPGWLKEGRDRRR